MSTHFFTTMEPYITQKINRNKKMISLLETQNIILQKEILLNYRTSEINSKKIEMIKKINDMESTQMSTFDLKTEEITKSMYQQTNDLSVVNYDKMKAEIIALHKECEVILQQVNQLNNDIMKTYDYCNIEYTLSEDNPEPNILE